MEQSSNNPKFGIELEFWNETVDMVRIHDSDDFEAVKENESLLGKYQKHNLQAKELYPAIIAAWDKQIAEQAKANTDWQIKVTTHDHKGHGINYVRYHFQHQSSGLQWWFQVTLDNCVLEIIAEPFHYSEWNSHVCVLTDVFIYRVAHECGYVSSHPNPLMLAGHLNVDYTTGFKSSLANVIRFMMHVLDNESDWRENMSKGDNGYYQDAFNALYLIDFLPYLEKSQWTELRDMYKDALGKDYNLIKHSRQDFIPIDLMDNARGLIKQLMTKMREIAATDTGLGTHDTIDEHYMGINTESIMREPHNPSNWRLELRRVIMPKDAITLGAQLQFVVSELAKLPM